MNEFSLFEEICDDILIRISDFLTNSSLSSLLQTSHKIRKRLTRCPKVKNNFICILSQLNHFVSKKAIFCDHLTDHYFEQQLPQISSFILKKCHCLIICKFQKMSTFVDGIYKNVAIDCYLIRNSRCTINNHNKYFSNHHKRLKTRISITKNSLIFYSSTCSNSSDLIFYYEFRNNMFRFYRKLIGSIKYPHEFVPFGNQFRVLDRSGGCHIFSFENQDGQEGDICEPKESYRVLLSKFVKNGYGYHGIHKSYTEPFHIVAWEPKFDDPFRFWLANLQSMEYFTIDISIQLNSLKPFHIRSDNQIILFPQPKFNTFKQTFKFFKYDFINQSLWSIDINFPLWLHTPIKYSSFAISFLTDNIINIVCGSVDSRIYWINLDSFTWKQEKNDSFLKFVKEPLLFEE